MLKKTIKYTDYDGVEREEDFYFNLNKAEVFDMELSQEGTLSDLLQRIIQTKNTPELIKYFKKLILLSYGEKSLDKKRFIKSEELSKAFSQTEAYVNLYMELIQNVDAAVEFVTKVMPEIPEGELAKFKAQIDTKATA